MKKKSLTNKGGTLFSKPNLKIRLSLLILFISIFSTQASGYSQAVNISLNERGISIRDFFNKVEAITPYTFLYHVGDIDLSRKVDVVVENKPLGEVLKRVFKDRPVTFEVEDNQIVFKKAKVDKTPRENPKTKQDYQQQRVEGIVKDVEGNPLMGVTVRVKGKNRGAITDENGAYRILVNEGETLTYSYVGFTTAEVVVADSSPIDVVMAASVDGLDAVQITAYGKTSKRLATGNITTITAEEIRQNPVSNVLQAVQGHVPGVYIRQTNAQPGSPINIRIRGMNTLNSNAAPLVIVDGVTYPFNNLPTSSTTGTLVGGNALNFIDPNSIETINFLKDADATAIYGSRGSNGVILITTKKGERGQAKLSFSSRNGVSFRGRTPELLDTEAYVNLRNEALANSGLTPSDSDWDVNGRWSESNQTDWADYFLDDAAFTTTNNISYSGGGDQVSFLIRGNYNAEQNVQNANGANHTGGLHFNLNVNSSDRKIKVGLTGTYSATKNTVIPFDNSYLLYAPNAPQPYNEDGSLNWEDYDDISNARNPASIYELIHDNKTENLISNLNLEYIPLKGLVVSTNVGLSVLSSKELAAKPSTYYSPNSFYTNESDLVDFRIRNLTIEPRVSYETGLGSLGELTAKVGATIQDGLEDYQSLFASDLISDEFLNNPTMADAENVTTTYSSITNRYLGFFGILNYNFSNKYLLNLNVRHDGSTKFGSGNRFGTFGSVGAGWIMSEESWFKEAIPFINYAKLRGSYGTSGGDAIANYQYLTRYTTSYSYNGGLGYVPSGPANPYLHWEKNKKAELSLSLELFDGRIGISESYYDTRTTDQLVAFPLSIVTGVNNFIRNSPAKIRNWGHELTLNTKNIVGDSFSWSTNINITLPNNKLVSYPNSEVALPNSDYEIGKSVMGVKLYNYQGVNPETGNYNFWKDLNEDGQIGDDEVGEFAFTDELDRNTDRTEFIDLQPKFFGGIQNNFSYKNFNLNVFFTFTKKNALNFLGSQADIPGIFNRNIAREIYDQRWQQPGDIAQVAKPMTTYDAYAGFFNFKTSTGAYSDATFLRLQNLNFSYKVPVSALQKLHFEALRFYVQGQNIFTISKYKGYDPETLGAGLAPLRTLVFGIDFTL